MIERVRSGAAADDDGGEGLRQMLQALSPARRLTVQAILGYPVQRSLVVQDVRTNRETVLRGGHDQVEAIEAAPGAADMDDASPFRRLTLDPASDGLVSAAGGEHKVRPRRL